MKKLFLVENVLNYSELSDVEIKSIYWKCGFILRFIRLLHFKTNFIPTTKVIWLGEWKRNVNKYDDIVVLDTMFDDTVLEYVTSRNQRVNLKLCYRNKIGPKTQNSPSLYPEAIRNKYQCSLYSYNKEDCCKYHLNYYNQFLAFDSLPCSRMNQIKHDVFFVGNDRGRLNIIMDFFPILQREGLTYKFVVVPDRWKKYNKQEKQFLSSPLSYKEVLTTIKESRCILDLVTDDNRGLTYRPIEALMCNKKLITNYSDIMNYDFYRKENVFILGYDNTSHLREFIYSDMCEVPGNIKKSYSFNYFIKSMFN